jgi:DNA-binding response OmpR family regulator
MRSNILCIEGKYSGSPTFNDALIKKGYKVRRVFTGKDAIKKLEKKKYHVVVVNAPSMRTTGLRICQSIRQKNRKLPIILISDVEKPFTEAKTDVNLVLQLPFTIRKLNNRIKPFIPIESNTVLQAGPICFDKERLMVKCNKKEGKLTPKTAELLTMLIDRKGEVIKRERLFSKVWETDFTDDTRTLDVHISWLRQVIEENPREPKYIKTLRGVGYRLDI